MRDRRDVIRHRLHNIPQGQSHESRVSRKLNQSGAMFENTPVVSEPVCGANSLLTGKIARKLANRFGLRKFRLYGADFYESHGTPHFAPSGAARIRARRSRLRQVCAASSCRICRKRKALVRQCARAEDFPEADGVPARRRLRFTFNAAGAAISALISSSVWVSSGSEMASASCSMRACVNTASCAHEIRFDDREDSRHDSSDASRIGMFPIAQHQSRMAEDALQHGCMISRRVFMIKLRLDAPAGPAWIDDWLGGLDRFQRAKK